MDRLACISVPSLPLQIALRRGESRSDLPLVVVRDDRPSSPILQLNRVARAKGLRSGMRYSEGLSLVENLKAVVISRSEVAQAREEIQGILQQWSPRVEACPYEQGSFWIGSSGLSGLYGSETQWGCQVRQALAERRYQAVVVVGLTRGGTYVAARSRRKSSVIRTWEAERRCWNAAPLSIFPLSLRHRRILTRLGVTTLGALGRIPFEELSRRFGSDLAQKLRDWQSNDLLPLQAVEALEPWSQILRLEVPVVDHRALGAFLSAPLDDGLQALRRRAHQLTELRIVFVLESGKLVSEVVRPAEPTTRHTLLMRLVELRLSGIRFDAGVVEIRWEIEEEPEAMGTGELFDVPVVRDLRRGGEAFAWIRAQWGNEAVVRPVLVDSHVPELSYSWEIAEKPLVPRPPIRVCGFLTAVRRVGWERSLEGSPPAGIRLGGPYRLRVAGGREALDREYWFLRNAWNEIVWVSWNRTALASYWEGVVD